MNCAEFESELQRRLDRGLVGDDDWCREHCEACFACSEAWEAARLLSDSIVVWRGQIPEVDLVEAVVAAQARSGFGLQDSAENLEPTWLTQQAERGPTFIGNVMGTVESGIARSRRALIAVAVCAVALISVAVLLPRGDVRPPVAVVSVVPQAEPQRPSEFPSGDVALLNQAGAAYGTLTKSAVGALEEFAWIVIPIHLSDSATDRTDVSREHWIDGLQDQLQPLQQGLGEALDFLREAGDSSKNTRT